MLILTFTALAHAAPEDFAAAELDRYLNRMSPDGKTNLKCEVKVDRTFTIDGAEAYRIGIKEIGFAITGTNANMALTGVYHLLENAGCRFLAPNFDHYHGKAEIVPPKLGPLMFAGSMMWSPRLKFRKLYVEEGHSHNIENLKQLVEWMPKVGYNTLVVPTNYQGHGRVMWDNWRDELTPELQKRGITIEVGGHGYQNFINADMQDGKLFENHPEWFGQDESGQRVKAKARVFCTSNAAAMDFFTRKFLDYVKDRPEIQIYDFWPPDGAKWCACDECAKLGMPPDRQAILLKQVAEKVKPVRPDLLLEAIAYSSYVQPPANQEVDRNVLIDFCPINQQFDHQIDDASAEKNKGYADAMLAWRKKFAGDISIYSYYRKYAWDSLPVIIPHYIEKDLKWYAKLPVQGISTYCEPGDWQTYELNHHVLAWLAWNPDNDVEAIVKRFCDARYGENGELAREALMTLERITRVYGSIPNTSLKSADAIATARDEMRKLVERVSAKNLDKLTLICTYALRDLEIQHLRATQASPEEIRAKATDLHKWVSQHADEGVFLINAQRLNLNRMLTRYGVGEKKKPATAAE